jgi:hypothetical protein
MGDASDKPAFSLLKCPLAGTKGQVDDDNFGLWLDGVE